MDRWFVPEFDVEGSDTTELPTPWKVHPVVPSSNPPLVINWVWAIAEEQSTKRVVANRETHFIYKAYRLTVFCV
jgi:hypothetical protein